MKQLIAMRQNQTMTSKELVEVINMIRKEEGHSAEIQHSDLMRRIKGFEQILPARSVTGDEYLGSNGQMCPMLLLSKEACLLTVSSESPRINLVIIRRWQELEQQNRPLSYKEALYALIEAEERRERDMLVMLQQAEVIDHKRIVTDESEEYLSVARVRNMNPNQRYSGALLGRISDKLDILVIPQHAAKGQIPVNTYHKSVWELAYPEASLFD